MSKKRSILRQVRITKIADEMLTKLCTWREDEGDLIYKRQTVIAQLIIREFTRVTKLREKEGKL